MSILIIGAKGMLGSVLCEVFADDNPVCWDQDEINIVNLDEVREKVSELRPDVIINAAAYTDVDGAEENQALAFQVNETGVRNLALVAQDIGAKIVHYSTDYVFPGTKEEGYAEDDSPGPAVNVYGESKLAGERALAEVRPEFFIIRTAWLYGPSGSRIGVRDTPAKANFVETMLRLATDRKQLQVIDDQRGSPTFTKDVAGFTKALLSGDFESGVYHAVNAGSATWFDFAKKIFEYSDVKMDVKPITSEEYPLPAKRPAYSMLQNTKGPQMRSWQDALREYIEGRS